MAAARKHEELAVSEVGEEVLTQHVHGLDDVAFPATTRVRAVIARVAAVMSSAIPRSGHSVRASTLPLASVVGEDLLCQVSGSCVAVRTASRAPTTESGFS